MNHGLFIIGIIIAAIVLTCLWAWLDDGNDWY